MLGWLGVLLLDTINAKSECLNRSAPGQGAGTVSEWLGNP